MTKPHINICMGSSCFARGNEENLEVITTFLEENNLEDETDLELSCCLCQEHCSEGPNIAINGKQYQASTPAVLLDLLKQQFPDAATGEKR